MKVDCADGGAIRQSKGSKYTFSWFRYIGARSGNTKFQTEIDPSVVWWYKDNKGTERP